MSYAARGNGGGYIEGESEKGERERERRENARSKNVLENMH